MGIGFVKNICLMISGYKLEMPISILPVLSKIIESVMHQIIGGALCNKPMACCITLQSA